MAENELTLLNIGKGSSKYIVLRKKTTLIKKQAAQREAAIEAEQEKQRLAEEAEREKQRLAEEKEWTAVCKSISLQIKDSYSHKISQCYFDFL